jgi:probable rRNA maturation factor
VSARRRRATGAPATLRVVVNREGQRLPVSAARLEAAVGRVLRAERVKHALVSLTLLDARAMAALNRRHLGHRGPTDIITFGFRDPSGAVVGDVYICPAVAKANAAAFGVTQREELLRLAVHGALHVLGYEHPEGEARTRSAMWKRQETLLREALAE